MTHERVPGGYKREHEFGPPPPGSGSQEVCKHCGKRRSRVEAEGDTACTGAVGGVISHVSDYDPIG